MKPHKIHSARFSANQQKVTVYTSCGRVQVTVDDKNFGIKVHLRPHKTKMICGDHDRASTYLKPKPRYKQVRTTRRLGTK